MTIKFSIHFDILIHHLLNLGNYKDGVLSYTEVSTELLAKVWELGSARFLLRIRLIPKHGIGIPVIYATARKLQVLAKRVAVG